MNFESITNRVRRAWLDAALIGVFILMTTAPAMAQVFRTLHSFVASVDGTNAEAFNPSGGLVLAGEHLYGVAAGTTMGDGSVFLLATNGSGFTNIHSFPARTVNGNGFWFNSDGAQPVGPLLLSEDLLYGSATAGGEWGNGSLFSMRSDGAGFKVLYTFTPTPVSDSDTFTNRDGASPQGPLVLLDGLLYGTTQYGGFWGGGTVFRVGTNGTGFTTLHTFTGVSGWPSYSNSDGSSPATGLLLMTNVLYGVAAYGGTSGVGTVFAVNTKNGRLVTLHSFSGADGANPNSQLITSAGMLYGTTSAGGTFGYGTVFALGPDGTNFISLHGFKNGDGAVPSAGLLMFGNTLYGTTHSGGSAGWGTVFEVNIDGTEFKTLHNFSGKDDGGQPSCDLALSGITLYGTAMSRGPFGGGTVFSIVLQPQLTISVTQGAVSLSWPTNLPGFNLEATTNLNSPVWTTNLPAPPVVNGQYRITNPISGTQQFFRLAQ